MRPRLKKLVASERYTPPQIEPPAKITVGLGSNHLAKMYAQNCKMLDQYANYTHHLENKYLDLYESHMEMKKHFGMMRDFFKHPSDMQFKRCEIMLEHRINAEKVAKPESLMNRPEEIKRFKTFKTAIKGQYYYIAYLKAVLHNNRIEYKKKQQFNSVEFADMDAFIEQIVNEKD